MWKCLKRQKGRGKGIKGYISTVHPVGVLGSENDQPHGENSDFGSRAPAPMGVLNKTDSPGVQHSTKVMLGPRNKTLIPAVEGMDELHSEQNGEGSGSTKKSACLPSFMNWRDLAANLTKVRQEKALELSMPERDERVLDALDILEDQICSRMYSLFLFCLGAEAEGVSRKFNKRRCDEDMERSFGSLTYSWPTFVNDANVADAARLFSIYLSRKVWVSVPWRKYDEAVQQFYARVCHKPLPYPEEKNG
jgi:hypothetical protein